jgi:LysM repeat protein
MWNPDDDFCIKHNLVRGASDKNYIYKPPKIITTDNSEKQSWDDAVEIATRLATGKFKSTIGNRNSYLNIELTQQKYPNSDALGPNGWATKMSNKKKIKAHTFGYLKSNDGYILNKIKKGDPNATEYTVARNDSLWKIAYMFNTTIKNLAKLNGIKPTTPLKIGQKIKLKPTTHSKNNNSNTNLTQKSSTN